MPHSSALARQRQLIASAAARLMAESGLNDPNQAKRKAALGLGFPDATHLPDNTEVENELRLYQRLFQDEEQSQRIQALRRIAFDTMTALQDFNPYLSGAVADGTAGRQAEIDIQLFTDSAKEVEIFLLNQHIDYEHNTPRSERAEAVLTLLNDDVPINLVVYPRNAERITLRTRDGRVRPRLRLTALDRLLKEASDAPPE